MLEYKVCGLAIFVAVAFGAHADVGHGSRFGSPAAESDAARTIVVEMTDNQYDHARISVRKGEVVRFIVHNRGQLVHEFNIAPREMPAAHQDEMLAMMQSGQMTPDRMMHGPGETMGHDDPNSVLLNPGETEELIWKFDRSVGGLEFACNVPGHYQSGMVGTIHIEGS